MARKRHLPKVNTYLRNNTWTYSFEGVRVNEKRQQITRGGFKTEAEAQKEGEVARNQYYRCNNNTDEIVVSPSFEDFIKNDWFPSQSKNRHWLEATQKHYKKDIKNYLFPHVGKYPINSITPRMLQDILDNMYYRDGYSLTTVSNVHSLIFQIFKYAKNHDLIQNFFFDELIIPKRDETINSNIDLRKQKRDIIPEQAIDAIFSRFPEGSSSFLIMAISLFTGARLGEAAALTFEECDFENNIIHIVRQMPDGSKGVVCNPKYNSVRDVPMCNQLKAILLRVKEKNEENERQWGMNYCHTYLKKSDNKPNYQNLHGFYDILYEGSAADEVHFVNVYERGNPIYPDVMKYASRIIHGHSSNSKNENKEGKLIYEGYNTHSFRHTYISLLKNMCVDDAVLSYLAGHKSKSKEGVSDTTSRYIHYTDDTIVSLAEQVDAIYKFKN